MCDIDTTAPEFEQLLEDYQSFIVASYAPQKARTRLIQLTDDPNLVRRVVEEYERRNRRFIDFEDPRVLTAHRNIETWYPGPDFPGAWCWPSYREILREKGWQLQALDTTTTKIMAHLPHPGEGRIQTRGLVVGHVQSGKTANYTGVISKAADVGYKLFIVMTGMTSSLRQQTQRRVHRELCMPNTENWNMLTSASQDFQGVGNPDAMLTPQNRQGRILCVVKKNVFILQRLIDFFNTANSDVKADCPVMVIDDEADQASINTRRKADERSAINDKIVNMLQALPKSAYIGYTATPFANIFIDPTLPEDLYPRHFIFDLPRPDAYFGAEKIFGREATRHDEPDEDHDGLDMIRDVVEDEAVLLQPPGPGERFDFHPELVPSLEDAIRYFLLCCACRLVRGQEREHSSMLIHTTLYTHTHDQLQELVSGYVGGLQERWNCGDSTLEGALHSLWQDERRRVTLEEVESEAEDVSFRELQPRIAEVFRRCEVVVDNGRRSSGLAYEADEPSAYIAIGGNTLSRGLTLEGLMVSYFVRTASAYDTLLQMGRWFGYRRGYEDLPRVWMTPELQDHFVHLATVESEIRHDIKRYDTEKRTPEEFAIRVQTHPKLAVTSKLKMQNVELASASYSDTHIQTFQFRHDDKPWLENNLDAARDLLRSISENESPEPASGARWLFRDVPAELVTAFLSQYESLHEDFSDRLLLEYIRSEQNHGALEWWNVGLVGSKRMPRIDLGAGVESHLVRRSRFQRIEPANIKALTSRADRVVDLGWDGSVEGLTSDNISAMRNAKQPDKGLLLLYPIDRNSRPARDTKNGRRHPLNASAHVIGVGLSFPTSSRPMRDYVRNNLREVFRGEDMEDERPEERDVARITQTDDEQEG